MAYKHLRSWKWCISLHLCGVIADKQFFPPILSVVSTSVTLYLIISANLYQLLYHNVTDLHYAANKVDTLL
jgi:hypothetical protein